MMPAKCLAGRFPFQFFLVAFLLVAGSGCAPVSAPAAETATVTPPTAETATILPGEPPVGRSEYRQSQPEETPGYAQFLDAYEMALSQQAEWIQDPVAVALRLAGYPTGDQIAPDQVTLYQIAPGQVSVVLLLEGAMDDSVRDVEDRVDLVLEDGAWRVDWAGARWRCQPGRGQQDWGAELCI